MKHTHKDTKTDKICRVQRTKPSTEKEQLKRPTHKSNRLNPSRSRSPPTSHQNQTFNDNKSHKMVCKEQRPRNIPIPTDYQSQQFCRRAHRRKNSGNCTSKTSMEKKMVRRKTENRLVNQTESKSRLQPNSSPTDL